MNTFAFQYNEYENLLIAEFNRHPFFQSISDRSNEEFISFLLQLGFLSMEFVKWYEQTKLAMESEEAKELVRSILCDEIPGTAPTHQDDRLLDLQMIRVEKKRILGSCASACTRSTVRGMYKAVRYTEHAHHDLRVLVFLRIFGELLVGETYTLIVRELERRFKMRPEESRFYAPHAHHDSKKEGGSHAERFARILEKFIVDVETLRIAQLAAQRAFTFRYRFYTQFV